MKNTIVLLFLMLCTFSTYAQEVKNMSLAEAIKYGEENSLMLKNALIDVADASERIKESKAIGLPKLDFSADYKYYFEVPESLTDFSPEPIAFALKSNWTTSLNLQTLLFNANYLAGLKAAKAFRVYSNEELKQKTVEVRNNIIDAYLPTLILEESKKTLNKNITNLESLLLETKTLYKEGFVEQLDVDRLELSLANLKTEVENLDRQSELAYNYLKFQMAYPIGQQIEATDNIEVLLIPATEEELVSGVNYENRAEYKVLQLGHYLNELNLDIQKATYFPSLAAFGSYQYTGQGSEVFKDLYWSDAALVGIQLNVPIFDGFGRKAKVSRAELALAKVENQQKELERAISLETQNARIAYRAALNRLDSQKANQALAEKIYNTTKIKYKEGVGSSLEISQAEQSLFQTQQNYTQSLYDLLIAKNNLNKALGK